MVGLNRRFYSIVEHGLAALGELGAIRGAIVEIPQRITSDRQSGRLTRFDYDNFYVRNSIHGVDLIRYVLGDPVRVHSRTWPNDEFDNRGASYTALLEYPNGAVGSIVDLWDTPDQTRLHVIAEAGRLELEPPRRGWVESKKGRYAIPVDPVDEQFRTGIWAQDLAFVEAVRAGRPPGLPAATLQDALGTMRLDRGDPGGLASGLASGGHGSSPCAGWPRGGGRTRGRSGPSALPRAPAAQARASRCSCPSSSRAVARSRSARATSSRRPASSFQLRAERWYAYSACSRSVA